MYCYEQLQQLKELANQSCESHVDYTYFKKSADVGEIMKEPKYGQDFIKILHQNDFGHKVTFTKEEELLAEKFFWYVSYYRFSIFPRLVKDDSQRTFTNLLTLYTIDRFIREKT